MDTRERGGGEATLFVHFIILHLEINLINLLYVLIPLLAFAIEESNI